MNANVIAPPKMPKAYTPCIRVLPSSNTINAVTSLILASVLYKILSVIMAALQSMQKNGPKHSNLSLVPWDMVQFGGSSPPQTQAGSSVSFAPHTPYFSAFPFTPPLKILCVHFMCFQFLPPLQFRGSF
ncbi:polycystic kidney disease protein 1-like 2 [Platysternon megacephalum]|uniref:Polycystic kidney disease protein 1-like 2 n=1 Tax=Platysternon megacephalum TaxID=55544 RepID=A0A4D9ER47_9SAUR|nr:polycystic kidney disease protein 1-like 2 [Platysternon megacephalum]